MGRSFRHAGQDTAFFYDSPLNDVFVANPAANGKPNNELLWASIRQTISDFLITTWRTGA